MTTGAFWDVTDPAKPFGLFDPDSVVEIPFDWAEWLAAMGDTYLSHEIICATGLESPDDNEDDGVITVKIQKDSGETLSVGSKYAVTCRITTTTKGLVEDQTLYLKVREK